MNAFLRALSPRIEFFAVILGAFGFFFYRNIVVLSLPDRMADFSDAGLYGLVVIEALLFAPVWLFLRIRGWTFGEIGLRFQDRDPADGIGLTALVYFASIVVMSLALSMGLSLGGTPEAAPGKLGLASIAAVSIFNPVFEEVFVCGYIVTAVAKRRNMWTAINISVAIRVLYHLYQGPAAGAIVPVGLVFACWYAWTGRLWPVVIAHSILDFVGLLALTAR